MQIAAVLQQSQPVVNVAERPLSRREEMALKAMSLAEVRMSLVFSKENCCCHVITGSHFCCACFPQSDGALCNPLDLYWENIAGAIS